MKEKNEEELRLLSDEELADVTGGLLGSYADVTLQGYPCSYCCQVFSTQKERDAHEASCSKNPKNT